MYSKQLVAVFEKHSYASANVEVTLLFSDIT